MANKRVSELATITATELSASDLFLLSDVSANESKQLPLGELSIYLLLGGLQSGSFFGTASWAKFSETASFVALQASASSALTASFALTTAQVFIFQPSSSWASQSLSSSYARTASFVALSNADSSSLAILAQQARTASYVFFTGQNNGKVYASVTSDTTNFALNCETAKTASYFNTSIGGATIDTASYALTSSWCINAQVTNTANFAVNAIVASTASTLVPTNDYVTNNLDVTGILNVGGDISGSGLSIFTGSSTPVDQGTVKAWMPVSFAGAIYFMPLYQ